MKNSLVEDLHFRQREADQLARLRVELALAEFAYAIAATPQTFLVGAHAALLAAKHRATRA